MRIFSVLIMLYSIVCIISQPTIASAPKYYGRATPNVYKGYNFYNQSNQYIGASKIDKRGGYSFWNNSRLYQGYQRNGDGRIYIPAKQ